MRRKLKTETTRALIRRRLRETKACECCRTKPALVTVSVKGKVKGFCTDCLDRR